jgi:cytochrome c553
VGGTTLVALVAIVIGFIWLPSEQGIDGVWLAICSAAGVSGARPAVPPIETNGRTSTVVVTPRMFHGATAVSIGRGATLALKCAICHGDRSPSHADTPDLAGQFGAAIYKELQDFRSGARVSAVMTPLVASLTDQDALDLAAYYSHLPARLPSGAPPPPAIVALGAPMRNIPPCAACHGGLDVKPGAPRLEGESAKYIRDQLNAFATGSRRNDISQQMRNIARRMTETEIEASAVYFSSHGE